MNNKYIVALDQGSSSSRAFAIDEHGKIVARASHMVDTIRPAAGCAEIDASKLLQGQLSVLDTVLDQVGANQVVAIAVSSQRSTIVFWDRRTGQALAPALSWQDGRALKQSQTVALTQEEVHKITGLYNTPFYSAAKIKWTLEHVRAVAQAAEENRLCVGPVASFLIWHLTKGAVFACDSTQAQRTLLFNINTFQWEPRLLKAFEIEQSWLPELKKTADDYGVYKYKQAEIAIRVCVGDQQAALCALQVQLGDSCINYGTGAFFMRHIGNQGHFLPGMLTSVAASKNGTPEYLLEGPLNACATIFTWLKTLGVSVTTEQLDDICTTAKDPILFLPALGGLGAPYWDFKISPVMAGFSPHTTQADIVAGVVDGIACLMADIIFYTKKAGLDSTNIKVTGGLSNSQVLLHAQADILQKRLLPYVEYESSAMGGALLAASSLSIETDSWQTLQPLTEVNPVLSADKAQIKYRAWQEFVKWCQTR